MMMMMMTTMIMMMMEMLFYLFLLLLFSLGCVFVNETNNIVDLANCDGATEGRTDTTSYRDAEAHLKRVKYCPLCMMGIVLGHWRSLGPYRSFD